MLATHFEVVVVSSPGKTLDRLGRREGVRTVSIPMARHISLLKDIVALVRLVALFARERPDIVHSMTPKAGLLAMLAAWATRVPVRIHTFTGLVFPTSTGGKQKLLIAMDRLTCRCATYINPEGRGVEDDLRRFGITRKPLHIIANGNVRGIDPDYYARTPEVEREAAEVRGKIGEECFVFCYVGRLVGDKGINELVEAFTRLYDEANDVRLLMLGGYEERLAPLKPQTRHEIERHPGIIAVGRKPDVRPYLAASDVFVLPSYREGFPNVVMEAGAMGLPSIVTDINGSNEIIIPHENGLIVPPRDGDTLYRVMRSFVLHPQEARLMALKARMLILSRYDRAQIWEALLKEYNGLSGNEEARSG